MRRDVRDDGTLRQADQDPSGKHDGIRHPGVLEAACIGIPDERSGERVKIFVVPKPGKTATAEDIVAYCREHLTGYKVPREVEFRDELPKTNVGKILRRELRDEASNK